MKQRCTDSGVRKPRVSAFLLGLTIAILSSTNSFASEAMLQKAWSYYLKGEYEEAVGVCRIISKDNMLGEEGRYIMGLSFLNLKNPKQARENFEFALKNYPKANRKQELLLGVADSYYLEGAWGTAEEYYIKLLKSFPETDHGSIVYFRLGESQRNQGKWQEAESSFNKIIRDFPLSLETKAAKEYLEKKTNFFSVQVGAFSKRKNAENLSHSLRKKGYDACVEKAYKKDRLIYRVRVGRFKSKEQARTEEIKLKKEGLTARICT